MKLLKWFFIIYATSDDETLTSEVFTTLADSEDGADSNNCNGFNKSKSL